MRNIFVDYRANSNNLLMKGMISMQQIKTATVRNKDTLVFVGATKKELDLLKRFKNVVGQDEYSFLEVNRVLYQLNRELQFRANSNKL